MPVKIQPLKVVNCFLFLCIVAIFFLPMNHLQADDSAPKKLRVMTYNTWYVFNEQKEEAASIKWIKSQQPDVVALQELTSIKPQKLTALAKQWGHQHNVLLKTSGFSVGLTSRWPIKIIEKRIRGMHHGYLHVQTNGIDYFVVHLSPFKWKVRSQEADIILGNVKKVLGKQPVIVLGDFNAFSADDKLFLNANKNMIPNLKKNDLKYNYIENLKNGQLDYHVIQKFFDAGLIDTSLKFLKPKASDRLTYPTGVWNDKKTAPKVGERVDFIFSSKELAKKVLTSKIPRDGILNKASDHYPVITEFQWPSK